MVAVAAAMQNLHGDFAALRMHRFGDPAMLAHLPGPAQLGAERSQASPQIRGDAAGHHEAHATSRSLSKEGRQFFEPTFFFFQPGVHGAHEHAIGQGGESEIEGGQKVGIRHGRSAKPS